MLNGAVPFKAYFNLDKTLTAVWIVACIRWLELRGPTLSRLGFGTSLGAVALFLAVGS